MAESKNLLDVRNLTKHFPIKKGFFSKTVGQVKAVNNVSFKLAQGECLGIVGESGCGKTTAGRTILKLIEPTAGEAFFEGHDIFKMSRSELRTLRPRMQIIFQDPYSSLNPRMTVEDIIGDAMLVHGIIKKPEKRDAVQVLLSKVGLNPAYVTRYPHEFSGGQRQRVGIARALALNPKLVVCDEAVSALDVSIRAQILNLLDDLQREYNLSYLFISHDLAVVKHISDRIAVMYLGEIVEESPCEDLFKSPLHPYTQALLSAIPEPRPGGKHKRIILEGDVPSPINPPSGCYFHPRCPYAMAKCKVEAPPLADMGGDRRVACWLNMNEAGQPAPTVLPEVPPARAHAA